MAVEVGGLVFFLLVTEFPLNRFVPAKRCGATTRRRKAQAAPGKPPRSRRRPETRVVRRSRRDGAAGPLNRGASPLGAGVGQWEGGRGGERAPIGCGAVGVALGETVARAARDAGSGSGPGSGLGPEPGGECGGADRESPWLLSNTVLKCPGVLHARFSHEKGTQRGFEGFFPMLWSGGWKKRGDHSMSGGGSGSQHAKSF